MAWPGIPGSASAPPDHRSRREQRGVSGASTEVLAALAEGNREYEATFRARLPGVRHRRDGDELLRVLRERLGNDPDTRARRDAWRADRDQPVRRIGC